MDKTVEKIDNSSCSSVENDSGCCSLEHLPSDDVELEEKNNFKKRSRSEGDVSFSEPTNKKLRTEEIVEETEEKIDNKSKLLKLDDQIWKYYYKNRQTELQYKAKFRVAEELTAYLQRVFCQNCRLLPVGSTLNRLSSCTADLDVCLIIPDVPETFYDDKSGIALAILTNLRLYVYKGFAHRCDGIELIAAKVPILRIYGFHVDHYREAGGVSDRLDIDINVNNYVGVRNSHLLHYYSAIDTRLPPLTLALKNWALNAEICDAKNGMLSSYALHLMILNFLQCGVRPSVLPNLQSQFPGVFDPNTPIHSLTNTRLLFPIPDDGGRNTQTVAELLLQFFDYYANRTDFGQHALSIFHGSKIARSTLIDYFQYRYYMYVVEPFNFSNVARCVYKQECYAKIIDAFCNAYQSLSKSFDLKSLGIALD